MADSTPEPEGNAAAETTAELSLTDVELLDATTEDLDLDELDESGEKPVPALSVPPPTPARGTERPLRVTSPPRASAPTLAPGRPSRLPRTTPEPPGPAAPPSDADTALIALLQRELAATPTPARAATLHLTLARVHELAGPPDLARAGEHYQQALRHAPDHKAAIRGARRVYAALARHPALPGLFDAELRVTREPAARARLLYAKGRVLEDDLRQAPAALDAYREALALDPGNLALLKSLERAQRRDQRWPDLAETYGQLAAAVDDPALRSAWTAARARLTLDRLDDPEAALALYQSAFDTDPNASEALPALRQLLVEHRRWPELVALIRKERALSTGSPEDAERLATLARLAERAIGDFPDALDLLTEAADAHPDEPLFLRELARLAAALGHPSQAARAIAELAEAEPDDAARAELWQRLGEIHEHQLAQPERARRCYEAALKALPRHRGAADALLGLHERAGEWAALVDTLRTRAEALTDGAERAELHHRAGFLLEHRLARPEDAETEHARALALDPEHHEAFEALARLRSASGDWRGLAELYRRAVDRAPEDTVAIAWLFRLGAVQEDRLDDAEAALATYEAILQRDRAHRGALQAVRRAATRLGRFPRVVEALRREATLATDLARRRDLLHEAAVITADRLGDPTEAVRALEAILDDDGAHRRSLETLARIHEARGAWDPLARVWSRLLPLLPAGPAKVRRHFRLGQLAEHQRGRPNEAADAYREALALDREHRPSREALEGLLRRTGDDEGLLACLEDRLPTTQDPRPRARLATAIGELREARGEVGRALAAYRTALDAVSTHRPALDARQRLLASQARWKELTEALGVEADNSGQDDLHAIAAAIQRATILSERQGATGAALDALRPVFERTREHLGALVAVETVYARTRDDDGLAATYARLAKVTADREAQRAALHELARVQTLTGRGDSAGTFRRLLALAPEDPIALESLSHHAEANGDRPTLLAMQARLATTATDPQVAGFHQARVGELLHADGDHGGAVAAFRAALELDPQCLAAARGLTRSARAADDADALSEAAAHERELVRDRATAGALFREAAASRSARGDDEGASRDLAAALDLDPRDREAADALEASLRALDRLPELTDRLTRAAEAADDPARTAELHLTVARVEAEREDLGAAVAAVERALAHRPEDPDVLRAHASYLERNRQWAEAADVLQRLVPKLTGDEQNAAQLRLGELAEHRLSDPELAMRSHRAVLHRSPAQPDALDALVRLERGRGRDTEALKLAGELLETAIDDERRAAALGHLAALRIGRGEHHPGAEAALAHVALAGPDAQPATLYRHLIARGEGDATWPAYREALVNYLERAKATGAPQASTLRALAALHVEVDHRPDRAVAMLREAVEAEPSDVDLSLALVERLRAVDAHEAALTELRRLLADDVHRPRVWRAMLDEVRALGLGGGSATVATALVALGEASDDEQRLAESRERRIGHAPPGTLGARGLGQLSPHRPLDDPATTLTAALGDVFAKLVGFDPERHGASRRERLRAGDVHPLRAVADQIAEVLDAGEFDLFLTDAGGHAYCVPASPTAIVLPRRWENADDAILTFQLARPLALAARGLAPLDVLGQRDIEGVLAGAARHQEPTFTWRGHSPDALDGQARRVARALPWLQRGRLSDAAAAFARSPTADPEAWFAEVHLLAHRAALLLADDLQAALHVLGEPLGADNTATDLLTFWVSDPAMRYRSHVAARI